MREQFLTVDITADLTVRVQMDRKGDLEAGVVTMLGRVDQVRTIDTVHLTGITPGLNTIHTDATVQFTMRLATPAQERAITALEEVYGIDVSSLRLHHRCKEGM